ncbi:hypothetical protein BS78_05G043000 [Paspalum vaginatum]|nr:hypothetical protein BS78_05G043000 [Paspalum vaginatum]
MGACASASRGRSNQGKKQKSAKVAAVPSTPAPQTVPAAASPMSSFKWRIDGISSLLEKQKEWTNSRYFEIKGLKWYLQLNLKDRKCGDERDYVSLVLVLSKTSDLNPDIIAEASLKLLIYDQAYGKHMEHEFSHHFQTEENRRSSGVPCMVLVEKLKEPSSGFIIGDSCIFGVELIKLTTAKAKATHSPGTVRVQKTNGFRAREAYTRVIDDLLALKGRCYSPEFEIGGRKYDGKGEFLSLYLHMAKTDSSSLQSSGVLVELSLSIKGKVPRGSRCEFLATEEEGDGWGWAKFMAVRSVKDWYLVNGSCLIEADVAIFA